MATWRMSNVISLCVESGRVTSNFSWACQSLKERISLSPILSPFHFYFPLTSLALPCIPQMSFDGCQAVGLWQAYSQQYPAMQKTENELWKFVSCGLSAAAVPGQPHIVSAAPSYRKYTKLIAYLSNIHTLPAVTGSARYPNFRFLSCWFVESKTKKKIYDCLRRKIKLILNGNDCSKIII